MYCKTFDITPVTERYRPSLYELRFAEVMTIQAYSKNSNLMLTNINYSYVI